MGTRVRSPAPFISLDIKATIAALAVAPVSQDRPLDGVNLIPHLTGADPSPPHIQLFWRRYADMSRAVRSGDWKLVDADGSTEEMELYDLHADIGEQDLLAKHPYVPDASSSQFIGKPYPLLEMMKEWEGWSKGLKPLALPTLSDDAWW